MKSVKIENNKSPNFIGCWNIDNDELCKNIINFFDNCNFSENDFRGLTTNRLIKLKDLIDKRIVDKNLRVITRL